MKNLSNTFSFSFVLICIAMALVSACSSNSDDVQDVLKPTINSFSPTSGLIGRQVSINGSNFSAIPTENTVELNGVNLEIVAASESLLTVIIADEALTGPFTVTVNNQSTTSTSDFEVITGDQLAKTDPSALVFYKFDGNLQDELGGYNGTGSFEKYVEDRNGIANSAGSYGFSSNDGFSGYATANFGEVPFPSGIFTLSFWVKIESNAIQVGRSYRILSKRLNCQSGDFFDIQFSNSDANPNRLSMELRNDGQQLGSSAGVGTNNVPVDKWVNILFTVDSSTRITSLYLDGELVEENKNWVDNTENISFPDEAPLGVSASPCINNSDTRNYEGLIDDLIIFTRVLTDSEIKTLVLK